MMKKMKMYVVYEIVDFREVGLVLRGQGSLFSSMTTQL